MTEEEVNEEIANNPEVQELYHTMSTKLVPVVTAMVELATKLKELWEEAEGQESPGNAAIVYHISEQLRQELCVTAMEQIQPGWYEEALNDLMNVLTQSELVDKVIH